jgi:hypothetical protein
MILISVGLIGVSASQASGAPPAFPGAVGQGAEATGGRGGDVYHVTTLDDYNPKTEEKIQGSFRHALRSAEGPRTIVFDVAGAIKLHAQLEINKGDLTIAGQTSPGGITVWGYPSEISHGSNVILRYLRFRTGDFNARRRAGEKAPPGGGGNDMDPASANGFSVGDGAERVIVDHVSTSWGLDETFSVTHARNVSVQNSIIAESFNNSLHPKGDHGFGSLVRGELTPADQQANNGGYTFFRNLWAHHRARNPSIGGQQSLDDGQSESDRRRTDVNLVNNVIYDWGDQATHRSEDGDVRINLVGNYYVCGPAKKAKYVFRENTPAKTLLAHRGNFADLDQDRAHDGHEIETHEDAADAFRDFGPDDAIISDGEPMGFFGSLAQHTSGAEQAYDAVVTGAGASLWRDVVDRRVIESLKNRTGGLIDSQEEFRDAQGHLPGVDDLTERRRPADFDSDGDGMPDEFEKAKGLDPSDAADGNGTTLSKDGYTNLEVYLNGLVHPSGA